MPFLLKLIITVSKCTVIPKSALTCKFPISTHLISKINNLFCKHTSVLYFVLKDKQLLAEVDGGERRLRSIPFLSDF